MGKKKKILMWYLHMTDHGSALRKKKVLSHATTWLNLKDIILSKTSQPKDKYHMSPLT